MDKRLTHGMQPAEAASFQESAVHNAFIVTTIMKTIRRISEERGDTFKKDDYNIANWALLAADNNGERRAYKEIYEMLRSINKGVMTNG